MTHFAADNLRGCRQLGGFLARATVLCLLTLFAGPVLAGEGEDLFENEVRPLLVSRCLECHGPKKQWASLRLDSQASLAKGGDSGAAIAAGKPAESELIARISAQDDTRMPPEETGAALTAAQVKAVARWVELGAPWPDAPPSEASTSNAAKTHWAFQSVVRCEPPTVSDDDWNRNPIDRFLFHRLQDAGLRPSPRADRRALIRRLYYGLVGLPPSYDEVQAFLKDEAPGAYERLVDRLLASPHYGEKWGRHWLDLARYSDTKGYVYAREQRFFFHASLYRDWVIRAFNDDLPYNRFLLLQLAADQVAEQPDDLAAMGLLTLGRRFLGVTQDIIDDRIDVVGRGLLGLTIGCARCHDHKYDPIPTADYYSLYAVFQNSSEAIRPIPRRADAPRPTHEMEAKLAEAKKRLEASLSAHQQAASQRVRDRIADYLMAQTQLHEYPDVNFSQLLKPDDLIPTIVWRWQRYLVAAKANGDPIFSVWCALVELKEEQFSAVAGDALRPLLKDATRVHPHIATAFAQPPTNLREAAQRYASVFKEVDRKWQAALKAAQAASQPLPTALDDPADEAIRQVLYGLASPCVVPAESVVNIENYFDLGTTTTLWKEQNEFDNVLLGAPHAAPHAVVLEDRPLRETAYIFRRGDPAQKGAVVPPQFLAVLAGPDRQPFQQGSGRLELARAIVEPRNPLTARVWVNRVWMQHFGTGLVDTPSDFGFRAGAPSHPELLDYLADELVQSGWSTKHLQRLIVTSAAYQQQSTLPADAALREKAERIDPDNRLLWRRSANRLSFEQFRDTLASVAGALDLTAGGASVELFPAGAERYRRTVYGKIDRQYLPPILRVFDFANPDLHVPQRGETTSPQQALFAMNHPFVASLAQRLAKMADAETLSERPEAFIINLYRQVLQRDPSTTEIEQAVSFLREPMTIAATQAHGAMDWSYGYGEVDEASGNVKSFAPLPHRTPSAFQGGANWPDSKLGWVQLTAVGGHPGNDLQHAAIRRWTAPRAMRLSVESTLQHEPKQGDGVRFHVIRSGSGRLATGVVHHGQQAINLTLDVAAGEHLDFVVDIGGALGYDQFLWAPILRELAQADSDQTPRVWHAAEDFPAGSRSDVLTPKQQLAQLLLICNELIFVD